VKDVLLDAEKQTIEVAMELKAGTIWACPECRNRMHVKDWRTRRWRHLDSCQFKTIVSAKVPVVECSEHGAQTVRVPWAEGSSRFTALFERLAIDLLQACAVARVAELLRISWDQCDGIKQRAVRRGKASLSLAGLKYVCVDEKAVGHGHDYVTVVTGLIGGEPRVLHVGDGRGAAGLDSFWEKLGEEGCARIKAVSIDMHEPYMGSIRRHCQNAEIIFDPFHLMAMMNKALDEVRRREAVTGRKRTQELLKNSRQMWLWGEENLPERHAERFEELKNSSLKTARAWRLKEIWRTFKDCIDVEDGREFFSQWYRMAMRSKLEPVKQLARTMKTHLYGILSYLKFRFGNAYAEGVNSRIQHLIQKSCGYRNRQRLKTDIFFHLGGLDLHPSLPQ
jgi:transposase